MRNKNVLVFPCGSEIGLEVQRSLFPYFNLIGASSVEDHGRFVYDNYVQLPMYDHPDFEQHLRWAIKEHKVDMIYPTMDAVIDRLQEIDWGKIVIAPPKRTTAICASKSETYKMFPQFAPKYKTEGFPRFLKPDKGYGSRRCMRVENELELKVHMNKNPDCLQLEVLEGEEFTIDCFTDRHGKLLTVRPRKRARISNGISVGTKLADMGDFEEIANVINNKLEMKGAWFFQWMSERQVWKGRLLEIACRIAGSSGIHKANGINLPLLTVYTYLDQDVQVISNNLYVEMDRALGTRYKIAHDFDNVYVDYDDTLIVNGKLNTSLVSGILKWSLEGKKVYLVTRHEGPLNLGKLVFLFDDVFILNGEKKSAFVKKPAIAIDDSFQDKLDYVQAGVPCYGPELW